MPLDWSSERYTRLYNRKTVGWRAVPWEARALLPTLMTELDRRGNLDLAGEEPGEAIGVMVGLPPEVVRVGLAAWLARGTFVMWGSVLHMPNFVAAQNAPSSDALRKAEQRARARECAIDDAASNHVTDGHAESHGVTKTQEVVTKRDKESRNVTESHAESHAVTDGHAESHGVTPSHSVLCCAVPSVLSVSAVPSVPSQEPPLPSGAPPAKPKRGSATDRDRRGTRSPSSVSPEAEAFCQKHGLPPPSDPERAQFLDYWTASTRPDAPKLDWAATWRNRPRGLVQGATRGQGEAIRTGLNRPSKLPYLQPVPAGALWAEPFEVQARRAEEDRKAEEQFNKEAK